MLRAAEDNDAYEGEQREESAGATQNPQNERNNNGTDSSNENKEDEYVIEANSSNSLGYATLRDDPEGNMRIRISDNRWTLRRFYRRNRIHLLTITGFIAANLLYIISDQRCPYDNVDLCATQFIMKNAPKWVIQILISAIIYVVIIFQGMNRKLSRIYSLLAVVNVIYLCFFYHPILNGQEYGQLFAFFLGLFICLICLFITLGSIIMGCYKKNKKVTLIGIPVFVFICMLTFYMTSIYNNCENWPKGIGNQQIEHDEPTCKITDPPICIFDITEGWLDFSRFLSCSPYQAKQSIMDKYYPGKSPYVGFARTEKFTETERFQMQKNVYEKLVYLSNLNQKDAADLELFLDRTSESQPTILIDLKYNKTLVDERSTVQHESLVKNVIVIYIDALSRAGSIRKLPKTMSWFNRHSERIDPDFEAFQFFKYHAITPYTTNNLYEAMFGILPDDINYIPPNRKKSFLKKFKENGFITGHAIDFCQISPLDFYSKDQNIKEEPYDHEGISFACDPHFHDPESAFSIFNGPYSSVRRCLYGKDLPEYVFEYGAQFWKAYEKQKKILYLDFLDAHEGTGEVVKYMDEDLYDFLNDLEQENLLEDTAVLFYADHGLHMQGLFHLLGYKVVDIEKALPALYLALPKDVANQYRTDIIQNQQKMVYSHDIHDLLLALAEGKESANLKTSLIGPLPPSRTCDNIHLRQMDCACTYN